MEDTVLSIDIGQDDCLYRILRSQGGGQRDSQKSLGRGHHDSSSSSSSSSSKRIVYVVLRDLRLVPEHARTSGPDVIRILARLPEWPLAWKTLTVSRAPTTPDGLPRCELDQFPPHALSRSQLFGDYPSFNILDLMPSPSLSPSCSSTSPPPSPSASTPSSTSSSSPSSLASRPKHKQARRTVRLPHARFLKLARFAFELPWLAQEILAHHILAHRDRGMASLAPRILGYAYEDEPHRVVGLLTEELRGRRPTIADLPACHAALRSLHDLDILHGDVAPGNMFVTEDNSGGGGGGGVGAVVKFIDFEEACVGPLGDQAEWEARKAEELGGLAEKLMTADDEL